MRRIAIALLLAALGGSAADAKNLCRPANPDPGLLVSGIDVLDSNKVAALVGRDYKSVKAKPETDFPWAVFISTDASQTLALRTHAGGTHFDFQEIEVKDIALGPKELLGDQPAYYVGREPRDQILPTTAFVTPRGIRLGVSKDFVTRRIGRCNRTVRSGPMETIHYALADERHPLLRKAGMPQYYAEYQFRHGKLVRFRFGFAPV